jgi:hypothetical protein
VDILAKLNKFRNDNNIASKGPLSLVVQVTNIIRSKAFPLNPDDFLTPNKGQVAGLGGANLAKILKEYGIKKTLAAEGGRTSRGNMGLMQKYIEFMNALADGTAMDIDFVEQYWISEVKKYFDNQPFVLSYDVSKTISASLDELFNLAKKRQEPNQGTQYFGTLLQHLVGAKLSLIMPENSFEVHGASVADGPTSRNGDFVIKNTIIHCTTAPSGALLQKCKKNLETGCQPVIITIFDRVRTAKDLASDAELSGRIEVWDIQQFLSSNIHEHSYFDTTKRDITLSELIDKYNKIIEQSETDPSLRIEFKTQ